MPSSTITSKGQITLPKVVRDSLGLQVGDRVAFLVRADGIVELRPETVDLNELYGVLKSRRKVSIEKMNEDIAAAAASRTLGR
jgi:AbrB family looped-hinge helix DNA binding protein